MSLIEDVSTLLNLSFNYKINAPLISIEVEH